MGSGRWSACTISAYQCRPIAPKAQLARPQLPIHHLQPRGSGSTCGSVRAPDAGLALAWPVAPHPPVVIGSELELDPVHGRHRNPD